MEADHKSLEGVCVLVVEDEFFIADDLVRALKSCGANPVGPVGTMQQANSLLEEESIDAAILDLNLHGDMAYPLVERLAERQMPCLIISGYGEDIIPPSIKNMARLEKPINPVQAMSRLSQELARSTGHHAGLS